jgi:hypothetical protein
VRCGLQPAIENVGKRSVANIDCDRARLGSKHPHADPAHVYASYTQFRHRLESELRIKKHIQIIRVIIARASRFNVLAQDRLSEGKL